MSVSFCIIYRTVMQVYSAGKDKTLSRDFSFGVYALRRNCFIDDELLYLYLYKVVCG